MHGLKEGKHWDDYKYDVWRVRQEFVRARKAVQIDIEETAATNVKIDAISKRLKTTVKVLNGFADRVWMGMPMPGYEEIQNMRNFVLSQPNTPAHGQVRTCTP